MKIAVVDFIFSVAEGLRGAPQLWGEGRVDYGPLRNWINGFRFVVTYLWFGYIDATCSLVMQPYARTRHGGVFGFFTGLLIGIIGFFTQIASFKCLSQKYNAGL